MESSQVSSQAIEPVESPVDGLSNDGAFESRLQERRKQREQRKTEQFDPPGFEDLFKVEMQVVGYKRLADIALRHQRVRDDANRNLYIAADQLLAATVGFYKVEGERLVEAENMTWMSLAQAFDPNLDAMVKPRQAMIRLLEGAGVVELHGDWYTWNTRGNAQVERELETDFQTTR